MGTLGYIDTICTVSGGSIVAGFLAQVVAGNPGWWPAPGEIISSQDWEEVFGRPFKKVTQIDIRTMSVVRGGIPLFRLSTGVEALEERLSELVNSGTLGTLPRRPNFVFCATELERYDYWILSRERVGPHNGFYQMILPDYPVARAIAASACFPPVFDPQQTDFLDILRKLPEIGEPRIEIGPWIRDNKDTGHVSEYTPGEPTLRRMPPQDLADNLRAYLQSVRLSDGGVFDNNGIEAAWPRSSYLITSNGGKPFSRKWNSRWSWRLLRYQSVATEVANASQSRWLELMKTRGELESLEVPIHLPTVGQKRGYLYTKEIVHPIDEEMEREYQYSLPVIEKIAAMRTDLDSFSDSEISILENHGYRQMFNAAYENPNHEIMPQMGNSIDLPNPSFIDSVKVLRELQGSEKTRLFGRRA